MLLVVLVEIAAVVRHEYNQQVVPLWRLSHGVEEGADALVDITETIILLLFVFVHGNVPGLVTAQGGVADEEGLSVTMAEHHLAEGLEGDIVAYAPFRSGLLFCTIVLFPVESLEARTDQIAFHLREVDVATIQIFGVVAFFLQTACDAGDMANLVRHLHHRHGGKREITTQRTDRSAISAIAVAEAVGEVDTLFSSLAETGHHIQKHFSTTLQEDDHHVGALCRQQRVASQTLAVVKSLGELCHLLWGVEVV